MKLVFEVVSMGMAFALSTAAFAGTPAGTSITYQGQLRQSGTPVQGDYDIRVHIFDAFTAGSQVGGTIEAFDVPVNGGLFSIDLLIPHNTFNGSDRFSEIEVKPAGDPTYVTLLPRQKFNAAPYALLAFNTSIVDDAALNGTYSNTLTLNNASNIFAGNGAGLTNLNASSISSGTLGSGLLSGAYANALTLSNLSNSFTGSGAGLTNLNAASIASGNLDAARLPPGGDWPLVSTLSLDSNTLAIDPVNNRVGVGTTTPAQALHVRANDAVLVLQDSVPQSTQTPYITFWDGNANEMGRVGYDVVGGSPNLTISNARFTGKLRFLTQNMDRMTITDLGAVGIGTTTPTANLHVSSGSFGDMKYGTGILTLNRGSDGTLMNFTVNGPAQGSISISGSTVSYNGFMGSHYGWMDGEQPIDRGALVRMTGENRRLNGSAESDAVYGIEPTAIANDPACLGAYLGIMEPDQPADLANPHLIAAVGNGEMLVVDSGTGDIQPGDYLISADVAGCAMKDDSARFRIGYVVARAGELVDWSSIDSSADGSAKRKKVSVFFENFVRDSGGADLANVIETQNRKIDSLETEICSLKSLAERLAQLEHHQQLTRAQTSNSIGSQQ